MILYIDTAESGYINLELRTKSGAVFGKKIKAARRQGEKLIPSLEKLLSEQKLKLRDIKKILVVNEGGSFTSLRIGVITANALAYALGVPVAPAKTGKLRAGELKKFGKHCLVVPQYYGLPEIGKSKKGIA